jgi:hypothetical protein
MADIIKVADREQKKRKQPTVVEMGGRAVISSHRFNLDLVGRMMVDRGVNGWVAVQDIAKFVYGNARQCNIKIVRNRYHALRTTMLSMGYLLIKEPGMRPWLNCKVYIGGSEIEWQAAEEYFRETSKRLSHERYEQARVIYEKTNTVREMENNVS